MFSMGHKRMKPLHAGSWCPICPWLLPPTARHLGCPTDPEDCGNGNSLLRATKGGQFLRCGAIAKIENISFIVFIDETVCQGFKNTICFAKYSLMLPRNMAIIIVRIESDFLSSLKTVIFLFPSLRYSPHTA